MRVLYLAGRESGYPRNDTLLRSLRQFGPLDVVTADWPGPVLLRSTSVAIRALPLLLSHNYDLVFVGFYGHLLMLLAGRISKVPILFDAFLSTYDTLCFDRQVASPRSLVGRLAFWLDRTATRSAKCVLVDTVTHGEFFSQTFGLAPEAVRTVYLGCDESLFYPRPSQPHAGFLVIFYSTYQPLHGADVIVEAASRLMDSEDIHFRLIGEGATLSRARRLADKLGTRNVHFDPSVPLTRLPEEIACADLCLGGPFGRSAKAQRVIAGKTFQFLAMGKPTIVSDTPANRELLRDGRSAAMCATSDPQGLANVIRALYEDSARRHTIALGGLEVFRSRLTADRLARDLAEAVYYAQSPGPASSDGTPTTPN